MDDNRTKPEPETSADVSAPNVELPDLDACVEAWRIMWQGMPAMKPAWAPWQGSPRVWSSPASWEQDRERRGKKVAQLTDVEAMTQRICDKLAARQKAEAEKTGAGPFRLNAKVIHAEQHLEDFLPAEAEKTPSLAKGQDPVGEAIRAGLFNKPRRSRRRR